jgi:hypothetical protein
VRYELIGVLFMTLMFAHLIWTMQRRLERTDIKKELEDSNIIYLTGNDVKKMLDKAEKDVFQ